MTLGIVTASPYEAKTLISGKAVIGKLYSIGTEAFLLVSGPGRNNAGEAADYLVGKGVNALLSWGFASGLLPGLTSGSVILPETLIREQGEIKVNRGWRTAIRKRLAEFSRVYDGPLVHCDDLLNKPTDKQLLHDSSSAIAMDRESIAVAESAKKAKLPFIALKVIADSAGRRLPAVLSSQLQETGDINFSQLLADVGPRPWQWPATLKLTRGSWLALAKLKLIAEKLDMDMAPPTLPTRARVTKAG